MNTRSLLPRGWARHPFAAIPRVVYKLTLGRWRYQRGADYAARDYWDDRLAHFGDSLRGPGWEGMSERANEEAYAEKARVLDALLADESVSLRGRRILEVGCGTGYWAEHVRRVAPDAQYVGVDITAVQFPSLRARFPGYEFVEADITEQLSVDLGRFDVVLMLDVIEHIVSDDRLDCAIANLERLLRPGGAWILSGLGTREGRQFFYLRWWTADGLRERCARWGFGAPRPFAHPHNLVLAVRAPAGREPADERLPLPRGAV
jgi:SAM-dependent methyltransferase